MNLAGKRVLLGYSGGPDAAALAYKLVREGAVVTLVYIDYRKTSGGKTAKDVRFADKSSKLLGLEPIIKIRSPLGDRPKSERNRFFLEILASNRISIQKDYIALGTRYEQGDDDLDPSILAQCIQPQKIGLITWDTFGVCEKAEQFSDIPPEDRAFLFQTTSCQLWWRQECGRCHSCIARHRAFLKAFGYDPTRYIYQPK